MTAPQRPERQQISEDHAFALLLRQGEGYERCYDAFAPALYRYCWTLLGAEQEDAAAEAVYETFLLPSNSSPACPILTCSGPGCSRSPGPPASGMDSPRSPRMRTSPSQ